MKVSTIAMPAKRADFVCMWPGCGATFTGQYKRQYLWKHQRKCRHNPANAVDAAPVADDGATASTSAPVIRFIGIARDDEGAIKLIKTHDMTGYPLCIESPDVDACEAELNAMIRGHFVTVGDVFEFVQDVFGNLDRFAATDRSDVVAQFMRAKFPTLRGCVVDLPRLHVQLRQYLKQRGIDAERTYDDMVDVLTTCFGGVKAADEMMTF